MNGVKSAAADREASKADPNTSAKPIATLDAASAKREAGAVVDLAAAGGGSDAETRALAMSTRGSPLVAEIELQPLALRPQLLPSSKETPAVETAVGFAGHYRLFILTVVLPMLFGSLYLFAIAAPRFASSTSFIVRSATQLGSQDSNGAVQAKSGGGPQEGGSTIAFDETYAVNAFLTSYDVVDRLSKNNDLRGILSRPEGDFVFRYPAFWLPNDNEFLYRRFQWMVSATVDTYTTISTIEANAFRPEDAQALATAMLEYAEELVNQMNQRSYDGTLAAANRFVAEAQKQVDAVEAELDAYRNASGSIDPNAVAQSKLTGIQLLSTQLAQIQATIAQETAMTPTSPNLTPLRAQAKSFRAEIDKRKREIAGPSGSEADKLETYDELTTRAQLAASTLTAAVTERDQARQAAERQHLFIQIISRPNLPRDYARYPWRVLGLLGLLAICLAVFVVLVKIVGGSAGAHRV